MPPVSKIAKLPAELQALLDRVLIENAFSEIEAVADWLRTECKRRGMPDDAAPGKSAVGEYSKRVRRAQETIAATTKTMQLMAEASRDDKDLRGETLISQISTSMFEALIDAQQAEAEVDPAKRIALLTKASLAAARLSSSSVKQRQWRHEVEQRAKAAADAVTKIAKKGGMTPDQVREIRAQILGVAGASSGSSRAPPPAAQA